VLHRAGRVRGAAIHATDGPIGTLEDFYFEEDRWTVRYLLVDTGRWLSGRRVLISPMSVKGPWTMAEIPVALTREQVRNSPEAHQPLSRAVESHILGYYGYPLYWGETGVWGTFDDPAALRMALAREGGVAVEERTTSATETQNLRSTNESTGYHLHATDGEIGHVDDFLIGEVSWRIRYLLVDTSNWIGGRSVVVSTDALRGIDPNRSTLRVDLTRGQIAGSPSFESIERAIGKGETGPPFVII
jgi:hypothetical protein